MSLSHGEIQMVVNGEASNFMSAVYSAWASGVLVSHYTNQPARFVIKSSVYELVQWQSSYSRKQRRSSLAWLCFSKMVIVWTWETSAGSRSCSSSDSYCLVGREVLAPTSLPFSTKVCETQERDHSLTSWSTDWFLPTDMYLAAIHLPHTWTSLSLGLNVVQLMCLSKMGETFFIMCV